MTIFRGKIISSSSISDYINNGNASFSVGGSATAVGNIVSILKDSDDPDGTGTLSYSWQTSEDNVTWTQISTNGFKIFF